MPTFHPKVGSPCYLFVVPRPWPSCYGHQTVQDPNKAQSFWISRVFYAFALMLVKIALLLFYLRLDHRPRMRWIVFGLMAVVIATGIAHAGISIFECSPPAVFWTFGGNFRIFGEQCMTAATQQKFWDATGAIVVVTDLCLWLCPIPMVWSLQLPIVRHLSSPAWVVSGR